MKKTLPELYHIQIEIYGQFPMIRCFKLTEEYLMYFSTFEKACDTAELLKENLISKGNILGKVEKSMPIVVYSKGQNLDGKAQVCTYTGVILSEGDFGIWGIG